MSELTYDSAFPGRFLKAGLFEGKKPTLVIAKAYMELLKGDKGEQNRLILAFEGKSMELVCNKTNAFCLKEMFGSKISSWVGRRVTFHPTTTQFGPKTVDCIRVYGSPEIAADIEVSARIGQKNFKATLKAMPSKGPTPTSAPSSRAAKSETKPEPGELLAREAADILGWTEAEVMAELIMRPGGWPELADHLRALVDEQQE